MTTRVNLVCRECGHTARRNLMRQAGARGVHETSSELAMCPKGHGALVRDDGGVVNSPDGSPIDAHVKHPRELKGRTNDNA